MPESPNFYGKVVAHWHGRYRLCMELGVAFGHLTCRVQNILQQFVNQLNQFSSVRQQILVMLHLGVHLIFEKNIYSIQLRYSLINHLTKHSHILSIFYLLSFYRIPRLLFIFALFYYLFFPTISPLFFILCLLR